MRMMLRWIHLLVMFFAASCVQNQETCFQSCVSPQLFNSVFRGYRTLSDGWISPFNGYQYKMTSIPKTQEQARTDCRTWGGDLAVIGVQDMGTRRTILRALQNRAVWIGAYIKSTDGQWYWLNDQRVSAVNIMWLRNALPYNGVVDRNENCAEIPRREDRNFPLTNDLSCTVHRRYALCEKPL